MRDGVGEAQQLVRAVYGVLDLFSSSEREVLVWSKELSAEGSADDLFPRFFSPDNQGVLARYLGEAGVIGEDGEIDPYALRGFQRVIELLPHFRAEQAAREPAPRAQVVLTVPREVDLPREAKHLQRSLAVRVSEALVSADRRVLLAAPYWSTSGNDILMPSLEKALELELPITLAGARAEDAAHHAAMISLGQTLALREAPVRILSFVPPRPKSLFHAKIVAGRFGYLGSANLTAHGLGEHVEVGIPLAEPDVERVWWLLDVLEQAGLLADQTDAGEGRVVRRERPVD